MAELLKASHSHVMPALHGESVTHSAHDCFRLDCFVSESGAYKITVRSSNAVPSTTHMLPHFCSLFHRNCCRSEEHELNEKLSSDDHCGDADFDVDQV